MSEPIITLIGHVATDVRFDKTKNDTQYATFRLAQTPRRLDRRGHWVDGITSFYSVTCWRAMAENVAKSVRKGEPIVVIGRQRIRTWQYDDKRWGQDTEVDAFSIGHDLSRGTAEFTKVIRERVDLAEESAEVAAQRAAMFNRDDEADGLGSGPVRIDQTREDAAGERPRAGSILGESKAGSDRAADEDDASQDEASPGKVVRNRAA